VLDDGPDHSSQGYVRRGRIDASGTKRRLTWYAKGADLEDCKMVLAQAVRVRIFGHNRCTLSPYGNKTVVLLD